MECRDVQKNLSAHMEGLLPPEEKRIVDRHLPACKQCRAALDELKKAKILLRDLEEVEPPPWLAPKIMAQVREKEEQRASLFKTLFYPFHIKIPVQALGVILIVVLAFQVYRVMEPDMKPSSAPSITSRPEKKKALKEEAPEISAKSAETLASRAKQPVPEGAVVAEKDEQVPVTYSTQDKEDKKPGEEMTASPLPVGESPPAMQQEISADKTNALLSGKGKEPESRPVSPATDLEKQPARAGVQSMPLFVVSTDNVAAAQSAAEDILKQLGAKEIGKITEGKSEVMTAELPPGKVKELSERLKSVGDIKTAPSLSELPEGTIRVRLEITPK